ncbi:MAG: sn-glycerol-3-phosphate ABC transporter ATP-binding protein UgpC [Opitutales bacterium]|nr:sn-glycerol-3-phosphate ABC transporter ATP-binding protein UgpC [Opitutales bacterium]
MATIELENIRKVYPGNTVAVQDLNLRIADGEFLVMVGPSGCGKSTALRMIAGLEKISGGKLRIDGEVVNDLSPQRRNISMVFQNYALYPHMSVRANLEFPLKMRNMSKGEITTKVNELARLLSLQDLLHRKPKALSGGQRQRVAMGRALVRDPVAFLMDEPLSNLDAKLRVQMRAEIGSLQRKTKTTTVYVTHDQVEAMTMGERVAVMRGGILQQVAPPQELYEKPANIFVAAFIGSPSMNLFRGRLAKKDRGYELVLRDSRIKMDRVVLERHPSLPEYVDKEVILGFRPEAIRISEELPGAQVLEVIPETVEALGHEKMVYFPFPAEAVRVDVEPSEEEESKEVLHSLAVGRLPGEVNPQMGESLRLSLDSRKFYFFEDGSGMAL